ncbi:MAG: ABC transporter ATP-binding protein/permease [Oscillospiraceae bacterium]|jgi:ABC-type multidrug transport system fused ATPase/permease subunit|nr:ABC transporter ATP-binding protein/permease [Oscillospiraceae bacterium]
MLGRLFRYFKGNTRLLAAAFVSAAAASLLNTSGTLFIGKAVDAISAADFSALLKNILLLALIYSFAALFQWILIRCSNRLSYRSAAAIRAELFAKLNKLPLAYFDSRADGDTVSRFTNDLDSVSEALNLSIGGLFSGLVTVASALVFMLGLNFWLALIVLGFTPITFIVANLVAKSSRAAFLEQQNVVGEISGFVSENVGNEKIIRALGCEDESKRRFGLMNEKFHRANMRAQFASSLINPTARTVEHFCYIAIALAGGLFALDGKINVGAIASFVIFSSQFAKPFNEVSSISVSIQTAAAAAGRVFALMDAKEESPDPPYGKSRKGNGRVEFRNVSFSYIPGKPLIKNLSFLAKAGSLTAIVGPTGAGKTTLVNLLMRFYEPDSGEILIDGENIKSVSRDELRRRFGMVLQDSALFSGTIAENIAYAKPEAAAEEIAAAAKAAHAHHFIRRLENGYDSQVLEGGENLSGGQKQLITIARAVLADAKMLILDEATSAVDALTEIRIQKALNKMMRDRTSFVIAHRLSTIVSADNILVLDRGDIVEQGTHWELLAKNGFYAALYYSQFE